MWLVYLSLALQIGCGIHAVKTGRPFVWVLVIILFSLLGCLGYLIIELIPEWWSSKNGNKFKKAIDKTIDPEKDLKLALKACELVDTAKNRMNLAEQYLALRRFQEAKDIYDKCLSGIYSEDPDMMLGKAKAEFGLANYAATLSCLDKLKATNPGYKSPDGHLLYARALESVGNIPAAIHEYETLNTYYPSPEPAFRLGKLYEQQGNKALALSVFQSIIHRSLSAGKHFNTVNKVWIDQAKQATKKK